MNPTLLSDPDNSRETHDAYVALTDDGEDTEDKADQHNFWDRIQQRAVIIHEQGRQSY